MCFLLKSGKYHDWQITEKANVHKRKPFDVLQKIFPRFYIMFGGSCVI